jgi:hypothetical protein
MMDPEPTIAKPGPDPSRSARRLRAASDALRSFIRDYCADHYTAGSLPQNRFELLLRLSVDPAAEWALEFHPALEEQVDDQLSERSAARQAFQRGSVFCFRCDSPTCEHATPPGAHAVFQGYSSTGVPEWHELAQAFVAVRDERVDQLYATPPAILTLAQTGHDLRARQLASFGRASRSYAILGQVVSGYYRTPRNTKTTSAPGTFAVTGQVVECRNRRGEYQLRLNVIPAGLTVAAWDELLHSDWHPGVARAWGELEHAVEALEQEARGVRQDDRPAAGLRRTLGKVPTLLHRFARALERGARQGGRRTRHAEERRRQRPVHKALDDLRHDRNEDLFVDEKRGTIVVCARQGRAHAFTPDGRQVTSLTLPAQAPAFRVRTGRWRPITPTEASAFREAVQRQAAPADPATARKETP